MKIEEFIRKIRTNSQIVMLVILFITSFTFTVFAFITPKYESQISVIVIQKQPEDKIDAFSAAKSAEYLSDIFTKAIYTDSFINDVLNSPMEIKRQFPADFEDRKKEWEKEVETQKTNNTGIIKISVFDPSKKEAEKIAQAITWNLSTNGSKYHGGGDKISINTIDGPTTSKKPTSPNVWLNTLLGFIIGLTVSLSFVYFLDKPKKEFIEFK